MPTNREAFKAKIVSLCEDPAGLRGIRWLCAMEQATQWHESGNTVKDLAHLFQDGVAGVTEDDYEELADTLFEFCGTEDDDSEEEQQIAIEAFWPKVEEFIQGAREELAWMTRKRSA